MGPIVCPETWVTKYQFMLRNVLEDGDLNYTEGEAQNHAMFFSFIKIIN